MVNDGRNLRVNSIFNNQESVRREHLYECGLALRKIIKTRAYKISHLRLEVGFVDELSETALDEAQNLIEGLFVDRLVQTIRQQVVNAAVNKAAQCARSLLAFENVRDVIRDAILQA